MLLEIEFEDTFILGGNIMRASIQEILGMCIREYRSKIGLSQEKFALKINMDRTYFASVESGRRNISIKNIEKIANGLDVSLSELFEAIEKYKEKYND